MLSVSKEVIQDIIHRLDIVQYVGARVRLKPAGREHVGCCPFHKEKTPSFSVNQAKRLYHCFGCGASGDLIAFVMAYEHLDFQATIQKLAHEAGVQLSHKNKAETAQRTATLAVLKEAAALYHTTLLKKEHAAVVRYLQSERQLTDESIQTYQLGYAPRLWTFLSAQLCTSKAKTAALVNAGLIRATGSGQYRDQFYNRILFPIQDAQGRVIGFGARALADAKPKYLNSPETLLFKKKHILYGLPQFKQSRPALQYALLTEGYMDVIQLHQQGIRHALASLGTAVSQEQLLSALKIVDTLVICFDADQAGQLAAQRVLQTALPLVQDHQKILFWMLPQGDPDSYCRQIGAAAFKKALVKHAVPLSQFFFQSHTQHLQLSNIENRARCVHTLMPKIQVIPGKTLRALMLQKLSSITEIDDLQSAVFQEKATEQHRITTYKHTKNTQAAAIPHSAVLTALRCLIRTPSLIQILSEQCCHLLDIQQPDELLLKKILYALLKTGQPSTDALMAYWEKTDIRCLEKLQYIMKKDPCLLPESQLEAALKDSFHLIIKKYVRNMRKQAGIEFARGQLNDADFQQKLLQLTEAQFETYLQ